MAAVSRARHTETSRMSRAALFMIDACKDKNINASILPVWKSPATRFLLNTLDGLLGSVKALVWHSWHGETQVGVRSHQSAHTWLVTRNLNFSIFRLCGGADMRLGRDDPQVPEWTRTVVSPAAPERNIPTLARKKRDALVYAGIYF